MRVLVTGGCGFIGATLVPRLMAEGWTVAVLDDLSLGSPDRLPAGVRIVEGSITDAASVEAALDGVDAVAHLAALASVLESVRDPFPSFDTNVRGTLTVLNEAVRARVGCVVFASSNAAVGEQEPPINEQLPAHPASPYGASKAAGEAYCSAFSRVSALRTVSLRFANAYGPHFEHKTSVIPKFFRALRSGEAITIYGDGNQTRDFVHVDDLSQAIISAIRTEAAAGVYQIATGVETSVAELISMMTETTGISPILQHVPQPQGEIRKNYSSIDRARRELDFFPEVSIQTGLRQTWEWFLTAAAT